MPRAFSRSVKNFGKHKSKTSASNSKKVKKVVSVSRLIRFLIGLKQKIDSSRERSEAAHAMRFFPLAEFDFEEIGNYIARDNPPRAVSFIREFRELHIKITAMPEAALLHHELVESIRMVPFGKYLISSCP
jgi:toxin ParE1/3/4